MIKKHIISFGLGLICAVTGVLLLAFVVPENVPAVIGFDEKIVATFSKWWVVILCGLPLILAILQACLYKKCGTFVFQYLIFVLTYENMLVLVYLCTATELSVGSLFALPVSLLIFLPLAFSTIVAAQKIKFLPYKSKLGIRNKFTLKSEFIWKQTHYIARDIFFFAGFALVICSIVFAFFHVTWVEIPIFVAVIVICHCKVVWYAKSMYKKLLDMEKRKENLDKIKLS